MAQLEAFENGIDAMDEAVTKNLQNFVRAINKENLYAMETFSWQKPLRAVEFGQWAIRLIEVFGENKYLKSYCRGFLRDIYKYLINAEVILGRFENFYLGIISIADVVYYITFSIALLYLTVNVIEKRRWN